MRLVEFTLLEGHPLFVNADQVVFIESGAGDVTHIYGPGDTIMTVRESLKMVLAGLLVGGHTPEAG